MSAYELDDEMVERFLGFTGDADPSWGGYPMRAALEVQLPISAPAKIGAVVRTDGAASKYSTWVLCQLPGLWFSPEDGGGNAYLTHEIGRITEVLAPGVDL